MRKKASELLSIIAKVGFALAMVVWLIKSDKLDFEVIAKALSPQFVAMGLFTIGISLVLMVERWRRFLISQSIHISFFDAYRLCLIGVFFNFVMPGGVGGDLIKGYYISKQNKNAKVAAAMTVFLDRLIGLLAVTLIALVVMLIEWKIVATNIKLKAVFLMVLLVTLALIVVWSIIFSNRFHNTGYIPKILTFLPKASFWLKLYESVGHYRNLKYVFFSTLALSLFAQIWVLVFYILAGQAMGFNVPLTTYFAAVPIAFVVQAVPISPGGIGVSQTATFYLFNLMTEDSGVAGPSTTTAHQLFIFVFGLIGAIFYIGVAKNLKESTRTMTSQGAINDSST